jgi:2-polyprenyl-3-methyl-5-hydroxy-6-metoxy-1,4-benzoquinol methylase
MINNIAIQRFSPTLRLVLSGRLRLANAVLQNPIQGKIDFPASDGVVAETLKVEGWTYSNESHITSVTVKVGNTLLGTVPYGMARPDVVTAHLLHPSVKSGFSGEFKLALEPGSYILTVIVEDNNCNRRDFFRSIVIEKATILDLEATDTPATRHPTPDTQYPTPDTQLDTSLPYQQGLIDAGVSGRVLHRENIYGSGPPNTIANLEVLTHILHYGQAPMLDFGCGIGTYVAALQEKGLLVAGIELQADYVATGQTMGRNISHYNGRRIPFADNEFETVYAIEVLEHIPEWENSLAEMLRVARSTVLLSVPNIGVIPSMSRHLVVPWHLLEATHVNFFTSSILSTFLSNIPGITHQVFTYGAFQINGEIYHNHIFAVINKTASYNQENWR